MWTLRLVASGTSETICSKRQRVFQGQKDQADTHRLMRCLWHLKTMKLPTSWIQWSTLAMVVYLPKKSSQLCHWHQLGISEPVEALSWLRTWKADTCKLYEVNLTYAKQVLEAGHSDVCGSMQIPTFSEKRYFVTFINEKSH